MNTERKFDLLWNVVKVKYNINKPKNSEASQFHHPPHDPSCKAHQLPKYKATNILIALLFILDDMRHKNRLLLFNALTGNIVNE